MPSRRRPVEPSPRLQALLASDRDSELWGGPALPTQRDPRPADQPTDPTVPWMPRREWLEGRPVAVPATSPGPAPPGRHRRPRPPGPAVLTVPAALRGARLTAPRAAALGMVLVVVLAVVVFGVRVAWARAASAPEPVTPAANRGAASAVVARTGPPSGFDSEGPDGDGSGRGGSGREGSATSSAAATRAGQVVVHVVGQVRRPGVVVLALGGRVGDALAKAGGPLPTADLGALNLARALVDGEQVRVPKPGEALQPPAPDPSGGAAAGAPGTSGPVNLNTATAAVLEELPGVGPVLAQRIVDWRTEHGRFTSVDELAEVSGIGEKMFAQLQGKVTV